MCSACGAEQANTSDVCPRCGAEAGAAERPARAAAISPEAATELIGSLKRFGDAQRRDLPVAQVRPTAARRAREAAATTVRQIAASARLAVLALAIVLTLAFGIPWLVGLVWK